jgi:hypothetical protein
MKKRFLSALVFGFFLIATSASAQQNTQTNLPHAVLLSTNVVDLGEVMDYELRNTDYRIRNDGTAPLRFHRVISTCNCISGTVSKSTLQPQEEGVVKVVLIGNKVHGAFKRAVWLKTNDPKKPMIMLSVEGEAVPVFQGLPDKPVSLRAVDAQIVWTNSLTLTATMANTFLGSPIISNDFAQIAVTVKTNSAEKMSYAITTIIKPLALDLERRAFNVFFPVIGQPGTDIDPLRLRFDMKLGAELSVKPNRLLLNPSGKNKSASFLVSTTERVADTNLLSWSPTIEGVSVSITPYSSKSKILLSVNVSGEAAQRLLQADKETELTLSYPNHKPAKVSFGASAEAK